MTKMREETKKKISLALKGRIISKEHRKNLSKALRGNKNCLGRKHSVETKRKISETEKGKFVSEKTREKQRNIKLKNPSMYWLGKKRPKKTRDKISKNLTGRFGKEKSPSWKGGISFEPYGLEFNEDLKEVVRNRDRRKCQICEKTELENGAKLDCHHMDYNKKNNNPNNLIALCHICHTKTNWNRKFWIKYFRNEDVK